MDTTVRPLSIALILFFFAGGIVSVIGCGEEDDPEIISPPINIFHVGHVTENSANVGMSLWPGYHSEDGSLPLSDGGLLWKKGYNPSLEDHDGILSGLHTQTNDEYVVWVDLLGLSPGTVYYLRAYAVYEYGTVYSNTQVFTTQGDPPSNQGNGGNGEDAVYGDGVTDSDGNEYPSVIIDDQEWMAENLRTTSYADGTPIPHVEDGNEWINLSTPGFAWYENDEGYADPYGALYNWFAVETGELCPEGWKVPSDDEWSQLVDALGGPMEAGGKLKDTGTVEAGDGFWDDPNEGATNATGFSALPGGYRYTNASFSQMGNLGRWWSADESTDNLAWARLMHAYFNGVERLEGSKVEGFAVRCLKK